MDKHQENTFGHLLLLLMKQDPIITSVLVLKLTLPTLELSHHS